MVDRGFKIQPLQKILDAQRKGVEARRSPELKRAWKEQEELKRQYQAGRSVKDISYDYGINVRTCYRIIND